MYYFTMDSQLKSVLKISSLKLTVEIPRFLQTFTDKMFERIVAPIHQDYLITFQKTKFYLLSAKSFSDFQAVDYFSCFFSFRFFLLFFSA